MRQQTSGSTRRTRIVLTGVLGVALALPSAGLTSAGAREPAPTPGAPGIGDRYFPRDGNGGYDVRRYILSLKYNPKFNRLSGSATLKARATQDLSRFNLDFDGLRIRSIRVQGAPAKWKRRKGELTVLPRNGLSQGRRFRTVVRYAGRPKAINDLFGVSGFIHTDDGAIIAGEPHVASYWFPVNDHPTDKAAYTFRIKVPKGLAAVANGVLTRRRTQGNWTVWSWRANVPMASYLATATVGKFNVRRYRRDGIRFVDAIDPDLFLRTEKPRTGSRFAITGIGDSSYKRLSRTIDVPAEGSRLSFWITRNTEPTWDFVFVEAHTVGTDNWTTLRELNGHTTRSTGSACPSWLGLHPFLRHYQSDNQDGSCSPRGTTGVWWAASGASEGNEKWAFDLAPYAGSTIEIAITHASDESVQLRGATVDDVVVSTGPGTTSFENDGNALDGWTVPGPPAGSPGNANDWFVGTADQTPPPPGAVAARSLARQGEILRFLSRRFGDYPFGAAGGIVDDDPRLGFALENQTRPIYAPAFFSSPLDGDLVVVHELAHQWYGDSLAVKRWRNIWLNEGFATYAEWMWLERENVVSARQIFRNFYGIPADDSFWDLRIGNPGPQRLFDGAVYVRGAMTLHRLRVRVGDQAFFRILRRWAQTREGDNVTTREFIRLAERVSGRKLDGLFDDWLFTARKPRVRGLASSSVRPLRVTPFAHPEKMIPRHRP